MLSCAFACWPCSAAERDGLVTHPSQSKDLLTCSSPRPDARWWLLVMQMQVCVWKVLKQLRGICEFCRDTCSRFSQQATIALLWGLQKIKSGELMRLQQPPTISPERKKRGRTRQRNETALEKCWFLALGLWAWQRSNKKPSSDLLRFCYTPQTRNTKSLKSKLSKMNILQEVKNEHTTDMAHPFYFYNVTYFCIMKLDIYGGECRHFKVIHQDWLDWDFVAITNEWTKNDKAIC